MLYISGRERGIDRFYVHGTGFVKRAIYAVHWHYITKQHRSMDADRRALLHSFTQDVGLKMRSLPFPTPFTAVILRAYTP
jgi:hypothetical protein